MKFLIFSFLVFLSLQSCAFDAPMDNLEADNSGEDSLFFANRLALKIDETHQYLKNNFAPDAIPWADALASASAYTAMWLMAKKKVESWIWWIITNITSIPLYFIKGYAFTSVQFIVLLILAIAGLITWNKKAKQKLTKASN